MHCHRDVGAGQQCLPGGGLPTPPDLAKNTNKHQRLQPSCCNEGWALGNLRRMERMEVDGGTDRLMRAAAVACKDVTSPGNSANCFWCGSPHVGFDMKN